MSQKRSRLQHSGASRCTFARFNNCDQIVAAFVPARVGHEKVKVMADPRHVVARQLSVDEVIELDCRSTCDGVRVRCFSIQDPVQCLQSGPLTGSPKHFRKLGRRNAYMQERPKLTTEQGSLAVARQYHSTEVHVVPGGDNFALHAEHGGGLRVAVGLIMPT